MGTENNFETYDRRTKLLENQPTEKEEDKNFSKPYSLWMYRVTPGENEPSFDIINSFLDLFKPKFPELEKIGVTKDKILFWLLYKYDRPCGMEFHPKEIVRLGQS